jgi:tyrosyl-tRNA synthetase
MILRNLQKAGHKPVILIGGGTTKVGDPSGKDESRQLLTEETIASNANSISQIFRKYITFEGIIITTASTTTLPLLILLKVIIVSRKLAMLLWLITPIGLITLII